MCGGHSLLECCQWRCPTHCSKHGPAASAARRVCGPKACDESAAFPPALDRGLGTREAAAAVQPAKPGPQHAADSGTALNAVLAHVRVAALTLLAALQASRVRALRAPNSCSSSTLVGLTSASMSAMTQRIHHTALTWHLMTCGAPQLGPGSRSTHLREGPGQHCLDALDQGCVQRTALRMV